MRREISRELLRRRGAMTTLVCAAFVMAAFERPASLQSTAPPEELPVPGGQIERTLRRGESHEWQVDLAAGEFLRVSIETVGLLLGESNEWPELTAIAPDETVADESAAPNATLGIEIGPRLEAAFVTSSAGTYRIRLTARQQSTPSVPYRLRVERRSVATDEDRQRLAASRLRRDGMTLFLQGTKDARLLSIEKFEEARRIFAALHDGEDEAVTLGTIGMVWYQLSDPAQGTVVAERALEIWRYLGRDREVGVILSDLGVLAYLGYDHPEARTYYEQALPLHQAVHDVLAEATTLVRLGWIHFAAGDLGRVIELNQQAIPLWREVDDLAGESVSHNDLGRAYVDLGEVPLALAAFERALAARPADRNPRGAAVVLLRIGQLYLSVADWQRALDALHQALTLARRANDARNEAAVLANLGSAYSRIGDGEEARRYLEPALELARKVPIRNVEANVLAVLGVEAYLAGDLERSRTCFQQAIAIQTAITDFRSRATTLRYLATTQLALGLPREALESITQSLEKSSSGVASASALATLATVHAALGDEAKADATYRQALERARQIRARDQEASALALFGQFQARHQRYVEARELLDESLSIHESLRGLLVDPDQRMSYSSRSVTPYELYTDVLMAIHEQSPTGGFAADAFRTAERARGRGLLELLASSSVDVRQGVDGELVERERALRWNLNAKAAIQTRLLTGKRDDRRLAILEREIAELSRAWREVTTRIRQQSPAYASLSEPQPLTASDVARLLDDNTVLLEFAPGESRSWLFAVTSTGFDSYALPPRQAIEDAARNVRRLLTARQPVSGDTPSSRQARVTHADVELADCSRALSDLVLGPIAGKLAREWRGRRLAIVAPGALQYVPFAVLPSPAQTGGSRAPLLAAHEIVTLPSASSLALLRRDGSRRTPRKTIAVFADPVFTADDPRVKRTGQEDTSRLAPGEPTTRTGPIDESMASAAVRGFARMFGDDQRATLTRLPFSRAEALAVASQVPRVSLLQATDFDATLALATSGRLNDYRIVHFATHGLISTTRPELSGLALSLVDAVGRSRDGFLRLNTIYNLRLSADLVVLSACQTALGKDVAGEGLVGLTRGFMYAGARRVIASLWQVSDVATAELMKKFYAGMLQRHLSAAAALRAAQLEMARDERWSAPYYWAGFILEGDWKQ